MTGYRDELFDHYDRHTGALDGDDATKLAWFRGYVRRNYLPALSDLDLAAVEVLEIGCNKGFALAALAGAGAAHLHGIDLAPADLAVARRIAPSVQLEVADAFDFLPVRQARFDVIVMKAVLEHVPKDRVLPLLRLIRDALRPGGRALIDVPNMDWLFASHERYMDFTHEGGFTPESLHQTFGQIFDDVTVSSIDNSVRYDLLEKAGRSNAAYLVARSARTRLARAILGRLLSWSDDGGRADVWARSLLAVGRRR
jgi:SAM-dependent methyltransferase